jgi:hypothetical protein
LGARACTSALPPAPPRTLRAALTRLALAQAIGKKGGKTPPPKVTAAQLAASREAEAKAQEDKALGLKKAAKKEVDERSYDALVSVRNVNRADEGVDASGVDQAIAALEAIELDAAAGGGGGGERNAHKQMRGAWAAYEAAELPALMEDKPGLKRQQYKEMLWKVRGAAQRCAIRVAARVERRDACCDVVFIAGAETRCGVCAARNTVVAEEPAAPAQRGAQCRCGGRRRRRRQRVSGGGASARAGTRHACCRHAEATPAGGAPMW